MCSLDPGICYIREEFLVPDSKTSLVHDDANLDSSLKRSINDDNNEVSQGKVRKIEKSKKNRKRGQNKNRPIYKEDRTEHLCNSLVNGPSESKCSYLNCRYVHDLEKYMESKPEDIDTICPVYIAKGFCPRGVTCRFAKAHLDEKFNNMKSIDYGNVATESVSNGISPELQFRLRKKEYDFSKCKKVLEVYEKLRSEKNKLSSVAIANDDKELQEVKSVENRLEIQIEKPIGCILDDIPQPRDSCRKSRTNFANKLILSPLTTVGNLPFRRICKEFGADITCGEMACAVPLLKGLTQEWALTKRHKSEDVFGVQLCGNSPLIISQAAQLIQETTNVDFIDLNIGCPIDLIYQQGGGSALMRRSNILELIVRTCSNLSTDIPFTVKMRTGVYADKSVAHELMPLVEEWGAAAVTLHGRSREQRYTKNANWEYIEKCATKVKQIPVIGNGDILSFEDYNERKKIAPHISSVMIGRGALIKPWIFKEIKEQKHWDPTSTERFDILKKYVNYGLEHWGSDTKGVENTRRFLLEWQSFMYRYIPYGLLLNPPQKINQRPQKFRGRDEMETLLISSNSSDWVKLSEMLLGRVPEGYTFLPKHKANAY